MDVEVLLFGQLSELAGTRQEVVSVESGVRLTGLIEQLEGRFGAGFRSKLEQIQQLRILVNGREYNLLGGLETQLRDKDTVVFLPPIDGG